jgi:hypothetical protein
MHTVLKLQGISLLGPVNSGVWVDVERKPGSSETPQKNNHPPAPPFSPQLEGRDQETILSSPSQSLLLLSLGNVCKHVRVPIHRGTLAAWSAQLHSQSS